MIQDDFIFDGESLSSHGYMIVSSNSSDESIVASNMNYQTMKAPLSDVSRLIGTNYEENYSRSFSIIKKDCDGFNRTTTLSNDEISEMTRWLCRKTYKWFRWESEDIDDEIWYEAMFTVNNMEIGGNVEGLELTVHTNRPFGVTREIKNIWNTADEPEKEIIVHTDEEGYTYPNATITLPSGGNINITNTAEDRTTTILNCSAGEVITIYGEDVLQIETSVESHDLSKDFNYVFPRLCSEYGNKTNTIEVDKDAIILFKYRGIRKVGI